MDNNTLLGVLMSAVGVSDIVLARVLGERLAPAVRTIISVAGLGFVVLGILIAIGTIKVL
jgi:hypothetical protein